jgi:hypothetical protein
VTVSIDSYLAINVPTAISFSNLAVGATSPSSPAPVVVTSNASTGYQLTVTRTPFANSGGGANADNVDIPLVISNPGLAGVAPAGTTPAAVNVAVPTSASAVIGSGNPGHITGISGDTWNLGLMLGPVPFTQDGLRTSTVTFTAVTTP